MTKEEAIKKMDGLNSILMQSHVSIERCLEYKKATEIAVEAIKRQIPMKPITYKTFGWISNTYGCPVCRERLEVGFGCKKCLQAIDWT